MSGIFSDFKYAVRLLRKSPAFTAIGAGMLAIGIGANTVVFSAIESFLLRPLPMRAPERLVFGQQLLKKTGDTFPLTWPDFEQWKKAPEVFENLAAFTIDTFNISGSGNPQRIRAARVTSDFFPTLGVAPQLGRVFTQSDDASGAPPTVVLNHSFWMRQYGGDAGVLGRTLVIDGRPHAIIGVMPAKVTFPMGFSEFWTPLSAMASTHGSGDHFLVVIGRLRAGIEITDARSRLDTIARRMEQAYPESNRDMGIRLALLSEHLARGPKRALFVLFGTVAMVLMICCANLANLMLARALHRNREIAIRSALGARRWPLFRQLLAESLALSLAGGAAGVLLAWWGIDLLASRIPPYLQASGGLSLNYKVLGFSAALSVLTGVLFGLAPAWSTLRRDSIEWLRNTGRAQSCGFAKSRTVNALVVAEIAVAAILLIGAGLLLDSWRRMKYSDLGYDPRPVLTAEIAAKSAKYSDPMRQAFAFDEIVGRLNAAPGVVAAAAVNWPPMTNNERKAFAVEGRPRSADRPPLADYRVATPRYAQVMSIPVLDGRFIADSDRWTTEPVAVVNERLARSIWPNERAVGKRIAMYLEPGRTGPWRTVVGVVGNVRHAGPTAAPVPELYLPVAQTGAGQLYLAVRTAGNPAAFARALESVVRGVDAGLPLNLVRPMEQVIADGVAPARFTTALLSLFSFVAMVLAAMGLYGVISYLVTRRTHEFGIRLALGATTRDLLRLVLRRSLGLTSTGMLLGLVGGLGAARLLAAVFEGVQPVPVVFGMVALVLVATAVAAAWVPLRRALALSPLSALREE